MTKESRLLPLQQHNIWLAGMVIPLYMIFLGCVVWGTALLGMAPAVYVSLLKPFTAVSGLVSTTPFSQGGVDMYSHPPPFSLAWSDWTS